MPRTTEGKVQDLLGDDYDSAAPRQLKRFVTGANLIINGLVDTAAEQGVTISSAELVELETWIAAYLYTLSDRLYTSRSTQGASGSFRQEKENEYLTGAKAIDSSGLLATVMSGASLGGAWLGKTLSEREEYDDRN